MAEVTDLAGLRKILQPLEASGVLVRRTDEQVCSSSLEKTKNGKTEPANNFQELYLVLFYQLLEALDSFVVVEREGQIIACAALFPFVEEKCGEIAAIAVDPECQAKGQGDKLLGQSFLSSIQFKDSRTHFLFIYYYCYFFVAVSTILQAPNRLVQYQFI